MRPEEEDAIFSSESDAYPGSGSPPNNVLQDKFPELVRAGGGVDPMEAVVSLLDRIVEMQEVINELAGHTEADRSSSDERSGPED